MRVSFRGSVNGEATVRRRGGSGSSSSSSSSSRSARRAVKKLRKEIRKGVRKIRREVKEQRRELRRDVRRDLRDARRELRRDVRRDLRRTLFSDRFARYLRSAIGGDEPFREIAEGLLNQSVQVETSAGAVSGTLIEVGADYMTVQETPSTTIIVPFNNVVSIQPL